MKRMFVVMFAVVFVLAGFSAVALTQPPAPFQVTLQLTGFGGGTQGQVGAEYLIRNLQVVGDISGSVTGSDVHNYNANFNLVTGVGQTWGTVSIVSTGGLCTGELAGNFQGTSVPGDFPDQDSGTIVLHGSGGCQGVTVSGTYYEPQDGVFILQGNVTP